MPDQVGPSGFARATGKAALESTGDDPALVQLEGLQSLILAVLRAAGGRIERDDLLFELRRRGAVRWRGPNVDVLGGELRQLIGRGLLRARLAKSPSYELTANGWDAAAREVLR